MTVYVESNFVIEHALEQEEYDSCSALMEMASTGSITLVVPAFSLAEPYFAISTKEKVRSRLSNDLRGQLMELGRSKQYREVPASFDALVSVLAASAKFERKGLSETISKLFETAEIIALDGAVLRSAAENQEKPGMSAQDAIVLASVLSHLEQHSPAESCFLNRNYRDFDDPEVRGRLGVRGCKLFAKFEDGSGLCDLTGGGAVGLRLRALALERG